MQKLLSIIVPTKNRYGTLKYIVETVSKIESKELELIIQDNSDDNSEFLKALNTYKNDNIKYFYSNEQLSVVDNSNLAVKHSNGEYVCFIGDDDSFSYQIIDCVQYMKKERIDSAIFNVAMYFWPGMEFAIHKFPNLIIPDFKNIIEKVDVNNELNKCLMTGAYSLGKLPKLYHGIVRRHCLEEVFKIANSYFPGPSPDMANAIALCFSVKKHVYIDLPIIISGQSLKSAGGQGARHKHNGKLEDMNFLPKDTVENWEKGIPKIWTGSTIYAESAIKALRAMKKDKMIEKFNFAYHYACFMCFNRIYKDMAKPYLNNSIKIKTILHCIQITIKRAIIFIRNILMTKLRIVNGKTYDDISDSNIAHMNVSENIKSSNNIFI